MTNLLIIDIVRCGWMVMTNLDCNLLWSNFRSQSDTLPFSNCFYVILTWLHVFVLMTRVRHVLVSSPPGYQRSVAGHFLLICLSISHKSSTPWQCQMHVSHLSRVQNITDMRVYTLNYCTLSCHKTAMSHSSANYNSDSYLLNGVFGSLAVTLGQNHFNQSTNILSLCNWRH